MRIKWKVIFGFLFYILLLSNTKSFAQKQSLIGINSSCEILENKSRFSFGLEYEYQLSPQKGLSVGLAYRSILFEEVFSQNNNNFDYSIRENYISIPILYKYYSNFLYFSFGANLDYYLGWDQVSSTNTIHVKNYDTSIKLYYGIVAKINKPINITSNFIIEPEIKINPLLNVKRLYYSLGMSGKYKF